MFYKIFSHDIQQHPGRAVRNRIAKTALIAFINLMLASCILGSGDRPGSKTTDSSQSALQTDVTRDNGDQVLQDTTLHDFRLLGFHDELDVVNDIMDVEVINYPKPAQTDNVDSHDDFENVINPTGSSWNAQSCAWVDGNAAQTNTNRPYVRLDPTSGWVSTAVDSNSIPRLEMIDGEVRETHGAVVYEWVILDKSVIKIDVGNGPQNLQIDGVDLDLYYDWLKFLLPSGITTDAKFDNHSDDLQWLNRDNVYDPSIWDHTVGKAKFSTDAKIYTISRWVVNAEYVIEALADSSGGYSFTSFDHGLGDISTTLVGLGLISSAEAINANVQTYRDLQVGLLDDDNIYMAFVTNFNSNPNCAAGGVTGDIVGTYSAASSTKSAPKILQPYIPSANITLECVGNESIYILDMTTAQKIGAGLGGYYDLFIAEPNSAALPNRFYFGRKYNKTTTDPVVAKTAIPLLLYNDAAIADLKNAFSDWRKADYADAKQACGS